MLYEAKYQRLGGWLLFAIIINAIYLALMLISLPGRFSTAYATYVTPAIHAGAQYPSLTVAFLWLGVFIALSVIVLGIVFVVMIIKRNPNFLKCFELMFLVSIVNCIALFPSFSTTLNNLVLSIFVFFIWTTYFRKSQRVRIYMSSDTYLRKSIFFKRAKDPIIPNIKL